MQLVALTGGIGCGKSEASLQFAALGVPVIDTDLISHQLTAANQPLVDTIAAQFGTQVLAADGTLDRAALRTLIFNDPLARQALNAIMHPAIYQAVLAQYQQLADAPYAILAIPLLDKTSIYLRHIDYILLIDCDEATQIARVKQRNQLSNAEITQIIRAQTSREARIALADEVIENHQTVAILREKILQFHQKYIKTCIVSKTIS